ncbi:MAG TPA: OmpA family protein [Longimicrobium sp.]|nr:OmpA family protein [Longimicrobium sp.]
MRGLILLLYGAAGLAGCATVLTPRTPPLTLVTSPDSVTVRDAQGRVIGTSAEPNLRVPASRSGTLELARPGWEPVRITVGRDLRPSFYFNLLVPSVLALGALTAGAEPQWVFPAAGAMAAAGALTDVGTGRAYEHRYRRLEVSLAAPPDIGVRTDPELVAATGTMVLREMADAADEAGCNALVGEAWRSESDLILRPGPVSTADSAAIQRKVESQVEGVQARLRELCARRNPLLDSLAAIVRESPAPPPGAPAPETGEGAATDAESTGSPLDDAAELCAMAAFGHCITFATNSTELRPELAPTLRQLAEDLRASRLPIHVLIEGTGDREGDPAWVHHLGLARANAVRDALVRLGVRPDVLYTQSCGADPRCHLVPGASGRDAGAEYNRRVIMHLYLREGRP